MNGPLKRGRQPVWVWFVKYNIALAMARTIDRFSLSEVPTKQGPVVETQRRAFDRRPSAVTRPDTRPLYCSLRLVYYLRSSPARGHPVEVWIEFEHGKWRISPDPARIKRGSQLLWRFRGDGIDARRVRWTIYFTQVHPLTLGGVGSAISGGRLSIPTETFQLPEGQHVGVSPIVTVDMAGDYKYGIRLEDLDEGKDLGDEDPHLIVT